MKPEPTIAQLAEIGAKASRNWKGYKLFREAFAKAVRDAVLDHIAESDKMVAPDPYAELKAAHAAGKVIQRAHLNLPDVWVDFPFPKFRAPPEDYRIKPDPYAELKKALAVGDVVVLKSGGPKMTISALSEQTSLVPCQWFDDKCPRSYAFEKACLTLAK